MIKYEQLTSLDIHSNTHQVAGDGDDRIFGRRVDEIILLLLTNYINLVYLHDISWVFPSSIAFIAYERNHTSSLQRIGRQTGDIFTRGTPILKGLAAKQIAKDSHVLS